MKSKKLNKNCEICGDKGVGRNFGAITCESCKAFFRRNSLKNKSFICNNYNKCNIDIKSRKRCKKCRLNKCISMGMKKEFIQNEIQKELRKQRIEENKKNKQQLEINSEFETNFNKLNTVCILNIFNNNNKVLENLLKVNKIIIDTINDSDNNNDQYFSKYNIKQLLSATPVRPINNYHHLNDVENKHLEDLCLSGSVFRYPKTRHYKTVGNITEFYRLWGNRIEYDMRDIVSFTKDITKTIDICHNDEIALVKFGCMEIIVLRANFFFDHNFKKWTVYMDNNYSFVLPMDLLKDEKRNLYGMYKQYLNKIMPEWNQDNTILDLLTAIVLLNPKRFYIVDKNIINDQREWYIYLMQRYLQTKYHWEWQWRSKMTNLMNALIDLKIVSQIEIQNGIEGYLKYFGPIFRESLS